MADRISVSSLAAGKQQRTQDLFTPPRMRERRSSRETEDLPTGDVPAGGQPNGCGSEAFSRSVLEASADCIKILTLDGTLHAMNEKGRCLLEIDDFDQVKGQPWIEFWSHDQRPAVHEALNAARSGGVGRFSGYRPTVKGAPKWWDVIVTPIRDAGGPPTFLVAISRDVTKARHHAEAGGLLNLELAHRVKNLFALVNGLITVAARAEPAAQPFAATLRERFTALSRALDYVLPSPQAADAASNRTLQGLLRALLDPYEEFGRQRRRFVILGDDPPVGPNATTSLALSVHELATNAVKYGALFSAEGRVTITCRRTAADECELTWVERGGPAVGGRPARTGFGSKLLVRSISGALGGDVTEQWNPEGLAVRLVLPLAPLAQ